MTLRPTAVSPGPQYREPLIGNATANAAGVATVTFPAVTPGSVWLLDYVVVTSTSAAASSANVYAGTVDNRNLIDGTASLGNSAVAAYAPSRVLLASVPLVIQWTGCTAGATCTARAEYRQEVT